MSKLLGHFLALAAMTVSVINAQCAVACSLHSNPLSPSSEAAPVNSDRSGHSCCPNHGDPAPMQPKDGAPCRHKVLADDEALLKNSSVSITSMPLAIVAGWSDEYGPQFAKTQLDPPAAPESPGLSPPSLVSILRI